MRRLICRLFGHAALRTWYDPWRFWDTARRGRTVTAVCLRCEEVVRRWIETSEEAP